MAVLTDQVVERTAREALRTQALREELAERVARAIRDDGHVQPLPGLHLYRHSAPQETMFTVVEPSLCVVAQGSKEFLLGESRFRYDAAHYLLSTVDLPSRGQIIDASAARPFLSLRVELPPALVGAVLLESGQATLPPGPGAAEVRAVAASPVDADLLDAAVRLVRLLEAPATAPILQPLITREIVFRLLLSEHGDRLRHLVTVGGYTTRISRAIEQLARDLDQPLRVEQLARELGMSVSGLHHHFKAVTALSPLQYQKRLRLLEARRLLLSDDFDAATAALRVGYTNAAHFNREYKGLFGLPPMRDVQRLRHAARVSAG